MREKKAKKCFSSDFWFFLVGEGHLVFFSYESSHACVCVYVGGNFRFPTPHQNNSKFYRREITFQALFCNSVKFADFFLGVVVSPFLFSY